MTYWIKLWQKTLEDPDIGKLPDSAWRRYIELNMLAGKQGRNPQLPATEELAWLLRLGNTATLLEELTLLAQEGLIEQTDEGWLLTRFETEQSPAPGREKKERPPGRWVYVEDTTAGDSPPAPEAKSWLNPTAGPKLAAAAQPPAAPAEENVIQPPPEAEHTPEPPPETEHKPQAAQPEAEYAPEPGQESTPNGVPKKFLSFAPDTDTDTDTESETETDSEIQSQREREKFIPPPRTRTHENINQIRKQPKRSGQSRKIPR
jgi:hypothetical protein